MPAELIAAFFDERMEPTEWRHAWNLLVNITGAADYAEAHHQSGEVWQYMGSEPVKQEDPAGRWVHTFRHRHHPKTGRREIVHVPATWEWTRRQHEAQERARIAARVRLAAEAERLEEASRTDAEPATL